MRQRIEFTSVTGLKARRYKFEIDRTGDTRGRYGRFMSYLDGDNFNARLIREGYAHAYRLFPVLILEPNIHHGLSDE